MEAGGISISQVGTISCEAKDMGVVELSLAAGKVATKERAVDGGEARGGYWERDRRGEESGGGVRRQRRDGVLLFTGGERRRKQSGNKADRSPGV